MPKKADLPYVYNFGLSAVASGVAETVTFPLDITKTRLQLQGQSSSSGPKRGLFTMMRGIVVEEGFTALYQGLPAAVMRHVIYTGARMGVYEELRGAMGKNADGSFPIWKAMICGMSAGAVSQLVASPTDLVKVQMQTEGRRVLLGQPRLYKGTMDCFSTILRTNGVAGLWRGWVPNVQRAALVNLGELTAYDTMKQYILRNTTLEDNMCTHTLSSACSGVVAATVGTPADVIKSRIMSQGTGSERYKGSMDCLVKTVKGEGVLALWKGFIPNWSRMAPWSLCFWLTYEQLRKTLGLGSF